jgi:hypothetical protein
VRWRAFALALGVLLLCGCGGSGSDAAAEPAKAHEVRAALEQRLLARKLSFRWVVCVRTKRAYAGRPIFRCNVNFGEPHIVRYCATLAEDKLVTNREEPGLRCGRAAG